MTRITVSDVAEKYLTGWLEAVIAGEIPLWRLPPSVAAFYFAGYADGLSTRQTEITYLEHQCDLLYMQAFTPKERHAEFSRRLEEHFQREEAAFFAADVEHENETGLHTDQSRVLSRAAAA